MAGIVLSIEVDDKGTVKVKQFSDETKKAFDEMKKGPEQAAGSLNSLRDSWIGVTAKIGIATAAFYVVKRMIYDTAKEIASATNDIERQAAVLGINTDEFQKWQYAAKMSDVNAQELAIGLKLLSQNMENASLGSGDAAKYFSAMGISVKTAEGHLRPLNQVMGDIMDKFAFWEDGPRKIAIAMQLFGRSGETLIPLLNKGSSGFAEFAKEAERLGIILSPDLVKKGGEAEDAFKRITAQWEATKKSFAGGAKIIADAWEPVLAVINIIGAGIRKIKEFSDWVEKLKYREGIGSDWYEKQLDQLEMLRETAEYYRNIEKIKTKPPGNQVIEIKEIMSAIEGVTAAEEQRGIIALAQHELVEGGWTKEKDIVEQVRDEVARLERETNEWGEITVAKQEFVETGWKKIDAIEEIVRKAAGVRTDQAVQEIEKLTRTQELWTSFSENISSAWSSNMVNIIKSTESASEKIKSFFQGIGDVFLSTVSKMITQWLLFGSITGKTEKGGGFLYGGSWGGLLGNITSLFTSAQEGGIFTKPTPVLMGDAGDEAAIPLKGGKIPIEGKTGGDTYIINNYNQVNDPNTFVRLYGSIVKKLSEQSAAEAKRYHKK
jgi:hypothetical protein